VSQCLEHDVKFRRGSVKHISDAASLSHTKEKADVVVNATGLLARKLGGVMDQGVIPVRGQIVLVRNESALEGPMIVTSGSDDADDELCYVMARAAGGGTILGGTYQKGNENSQPDPNQAVRIMKRAVEICPPLTDGKGIDSLDIIRRGVGLRPVREGGVRISKETINGIPVVHNYGHGGWGYQGSYGCAQGAVGLVLDILSSIS